MSGTDSPRYFNAAGLGATEGGARRTHRRMRVARLEPPSPTEPSACQVRALETLREAGAGIEPAVELLQRSG